MDKLDATRITLTVPVFNNARCVVFLVSGADKASAVKAAIEGPDAPDEVPAQLIQLRAGKIVWLVDQGAARMLQRAGGD